jgi:hypothetical protein
MRKIAFSIMVILAVFVIPTVIIDNPHALTLICFDDDGDGYADGNSVCTVPGGGPCGVTMAIQI